MLKVLFKVDGLMGDSGHCGLFGAFHCLLNAIIRAQEGGGNIMKGHMIKGKVW